MTACPTPDELRRLLADKVSGGDAAAFAAHLKTCPACQQALNRLTLSGPGRPDVADDPTVSGEPGETTRSGVDDFFRRLERNPSGEHGPSGLDTLGASPGGVPETPPSIPGYEVQEVLGRGGMGVVWKARQIRLNRPVALKMVIGADPHTLVRFLAEAEVMAAVRHPHVAAVYDFGTHDGRPYLALEYLPRGTLGQRLAVEPTLTPAEAAGLVGKVARAVGAAHELGIVHRDLKPANVLFDEAGEPKVTDFGLAKRGTDSNLTASQAVMGTPAYMAPEQAKGEAKFAGPPADVWALGVILYECLTGTRPFNHPDLMALIRMVSDEEPVPPRRRAPSVPRDLETICLKCLEKDPARRYQTAKELADDLGRYVNRFPILARRAGPFGRAKKWLRRNPVVSAAGLTVLLAVATAGFFAWQAHESERQRQADERRREEEALAEKRRAAVERGMTAALGADLQAAEKAVAEAEQLGASAGETQMLRGFIDTYTGRVSEAIGRLEEAVRLMPESVSARALLADAYATASDWTAARRVGAEAAALTPRTPEDKLFLGMAIGTFAPAEALPLMDAALAERPSGIGHVLRADVRSALATVTGSVADAEAAIIDAELAKRLLPGNSFPPTTAAFARLAAAAAYRYIGQADKADEQLAAAGREADELARYRGNYGAVSTRFCVALIRDGLDGRMDMLAELRETRATAPAAGIAYLEAYNLFCLGRDAEAAAMADRFPDDRQHGHALFALALGRPDGRGDARKAWERISGPGRPPLYRIETAPMLFVVGGPGDREATARELRAELPRFGPSSYGPGEPATLLAFLEGTLSEAELLSRRATTELERCRRYYWVAWKRLGAGDRAGAEAAFREAYGVRLASYQFFWTSRAILIRMKDPNWPSWPATRK